MPLLQFYTSPNQLTQAEREQLSAVITAFYARLFPAFFVAIVFNEVCSTQLPTRQLEQTRFDIKTEQLI